ncbi:MAG: isoprenylcysteine carboxylmethyltransferase family protein [Actinobacteria bacterium]|jgi:protein-S-isoprenylcysteine O-methyltransferase Ste14|nr:isoprenylcysteine carboxylmethyltransferase family protein [Actinomycetota bacterium]
MSGYALVQFTLFAVWALLAGVGGLLLQRHRTGDSGFRFAAAPRGSEQWWANRIFAAGSVAVGIGAPLADLLGLTVGGALDNTRLHAAGVVVAVFGISLTCAAQLAMGASWRIGVDPAERTALVTGGPFRLVRNPIFSAAILTFTGLAATVPNAVALVGLGLVVIGIQIQVRRIEEPYLRSVHGRHYQQYAARVGRLLPGIGRLRAPRP